MTFIVSCTEFEREAKVETGTVSEITWSSVRINGKIIDVGMGVTDYGFCWSTSQEPDISNFKTSLGSTALLGNFECNIVGLESMTIYFIKAYLKSLDKVVYGNQVSFTTDPLNIIDADGNIYNVIRIGTQLWMKENLKTTKYNDGTNIPLVTDNTAWSNLTTPGYCWYNNDAGSYKNVYGALYNWYAVNTGKLCPVGWHVPSDNEWTILENYLGGWEVAGGKLKATGTIEAGTGLWYSPNTGATNETGFTAVPGGYRSYGGYFNSFGYDGHWWSSTEYSSSNAWYRLMNHMDSYSIRVSNHKPNGFSVRCVRD